MMKIIIFIEFMFVLNCDCSNNKEEIDTPLQGTWIPAFIYLNDEYKNYRNLPREQQQLEELTTETNKSRKDFIIFLEQCLSAEDHLYLEKLAFKNSKTIISIREEEDPMSYVNRHVDGLDHRNHMVIQSHKTSVREVLKFSDKFLEQYIDLIQLHSHLTVFRFLWYPEYKNNATQFKKENFELFLNSYLPHFHHNGTFVMYTSEKNNCTINEFNVTRPWIIDLKRAGSTDVWCKTPNMIIAVADLHILYSGRFVKKLQGQRFCETTHHRGRLSTVMRVDSFKNVGAFDQRIVHLYNATHDVDLRIDITLPRYEENYEYYTVDRIYVSGRSHEAHFANKLVKVGHTFFNKVQRIVLVKGCPTTGGLVMGAVAVEYCKNCSNKTEFSQPDAKRIIFRVESNLKLRCEVKDYFNVLAFIKSIQFTGIILGTCLMCSYILVLTMIRFRFFLMSLYELMKIYLKGLLECIETCIYIAVYFITSIAISIKQCFGITAYVIQLYIYKTFTWLTAQFSSNRPISTKERLKTIGYDCVMFMGNLIIYTIQSVIATTVIRGILGKLTQNTPNKAPSI